MMTTENMAAVEMNDAELVAGSLAGDRSAFGRIVERYQALVCSLAYSATGSLAHSEDLAQEAFLQAWKELPKLREPSKLRPWLCSIVRYLSHKARRRDAREPAHAAETLEILAEVPALEPLPPDRAIRQEEEVILWRSLERIPESYREPLVLFYRKHQSVESVARALEMSEDAVKQRLSRGRRLLHAEVLAFVEGALERTNPGRVFTTGVLAALPVLTPSVEAAAIGAVAAAGKGASTVKGAGLLGVAGFAGLVVAAIVGQIAGLWGRVKGGHSVRERRFLARASWGVLAWKVLLLVAILTVMSFSGEVIRINSLSDTGRWVALWLVLLGLWVAYSIWVARRQTRIQLEERTVTAVASGQMGERTTRVELAAQAYGGLAAWIFGPSSLLILLLHHQGNRFLGSSLLVVAVATWLMSARIIMSHPERIRLVFSAVWWGQALVVLATLNVLWASWVPNPEVLWPNKPDGLHFAPLFLNFLVVVFYGSIELARWLMRRFARPQS